ncbi:MAG: KilA-N domain-containing protein [Crocinitomicaceae bacterium]|nr:KilA-N domain-containing protein [Crocinitomicaceae bacterium]MBK8924788.1 KilA-N domain-containing protein [Crocinitomicaceae bacterium]
MKKIRIKDTEIEIISIDHGDYISLTDMANAKESESRAADIIKNWLRTRYALEFLSTWEQIHNKNFKVVESDHFKSQAGLHSFVLSASEWIEKTNALGIFVKKGKYGGTFAHKDIAFEFGSAISVSFKLYLITEFQRLKESENKHLGWTAKRELTKINHYCPIKYFRTTLKPMAPIDFNK